MPMTVPDLKKSLRDMSEKLYNDLGLEPPPKPTRRAKIKKWLGTVPGYQFVFLVAIIFIVASTYIGPLLRDDVTVETFELDGETRVCVIARDAGVWCDEP